MRHLHIVAGIAVNAINIDDPGKFPAMRLVPSDTADIGDLCDEQGVFSKSPDAEAQRAAIAARQARLAEINAALLADNGLMAIALMTDQEYNAWFAANVTNAAQPVVELAKLVKRLVRYEARQLLK